MQQHMSIKVDMVSKSTCTYFGILRRALMGFSPNRGGVLSAISIAVIPRDQLSALES